MAQLSDIRCMLYVVMCFAGVAVWVVLPFLLVLNVQTMWLWPCVLQKAPTSSTMSMASEPMTYPKVLAALRDPSGSLAKALRHQPTKCPLFLQLSAPNISGPESPTCVAFSYVLQKAPTSSRMSMASEPMTYPEALAALRDPSGSLTKALRHQRAHVLQSLPGNGRFLGSMLMCCIGPAAGAGFREGGLLAEERVWVLALARVALDTTTQPEMAGVLQGIYTSLTGKWQWSFCIS